MGDKTHGLLGAWMWQMQETPFFRVTPEGWLVHEGVPPL